MTALNPTVVDHIRSRCNASQLRAVAAACAPTVQSQTRTPGGFTLLQGPPGTGKTTVILHILNFLHLLQYQRYYEKRLPQLRADWVPDAAAPPAAARAMDDVKSRNGQGGAGAGGASGPAAGSGGLAALLKGMAQGASLGAAAQASNASKPRILVCAPSNAAVDLLVERLLRDRLRDANGFYTPDMIRVGSPSSCSERIRVVTLDHRVDAIISSVGGELENALARLDDHHRTLMHRRQKLQEEARGFALAEGEPPHSMDKELIDTGTKIEEIKRERERLKILALAKGGEITEEIKDQLRAKLLEDAQIVFTTLNSSGQEFFARMSVGFSTVVIDEACQAVEAATLIPLQLAARRCILVGDPKQLPATVISTSDTAALYQRSLFERLMCEGHVVHVLDTQYRMHPCIRQFPSEYFYNGVLKDGPNVAHAARAHALVGEHSDIQVAPVAPAGVAAASACFWHEAQGGPGAHGVAPGAASAPHRLMVPVGGPVSGGAARSGADGREKPYQADEWFGPFRFFDLQQSRESRGGAAGMSLRNKSEAALVRVLCRELFRKYSPNGELRGRVCVLTPYRQQRAEILDALQREFGRDAVSGAVPDGRRSPPLDGRRSPPLGARPEAGTAGGQEKGLGQLMHVMTVDACQGQEHDIVILSCVRANARGAVGFVNDVRRMNVALTRAKVCSPLPRLPVFTSPLPRTPAYPLLICHPQHPHAVCCTHAAAAATWA